MQTMVAFRGEVLAWPAGAQKPYSNVFDRTKTISDPARLFVNGFTLTNIYSPELDATVCM